MLANSADADEMHHMRHFIWVSTVFLSICLPVSRMKRVILGSAVDLAYTIKTNTVCILLKHISLIRSPLNLWFYFELSVVRIIV